MITLRYHSKYALLLSFQATKNDNKSAYFVLPIFQLEMLKLEDIFLEI